MAGSFVLKLPAVHIFCNYSVIGIAKLAFIGYDEGEEGWR